MRIALLTAVWGRSRLARMVLQHNGSIEVSGVDIVNVAVYSRQDPEAHRMIDVAGWHYIQYPNRPLSNKWNAGCAFIRKLHVDAMMIFGSDDFLNAAYLEAVVDTLKSGAHYVMPHSMYFYHAPSRQAIYCMNIGRVGGGRTLSRHLLGRMDYQPWEPGYMRNIDGAMDRRLIAVGHKHPDGTVDDIREHSALLMGVKTQDSDNLHSFHKMQRGLESEVIFGPDLLRRYVPGCAEKLLRW